MKCALVIFGLMISTSYVHAQTVCTLKVGVAAATPSGFKETVFPLTSGDGIHYGDEMASYGNYGVRVWVIQDKLTKKDIGFRASIYRSDDHTQASAAELPISKNSNLHLDKEFGANGSGPEGTVSEYANINCQ